ncbi:MAG TPA: SpoIIE family protein phosphatase [Terriglobales bacterium]|nr:SpoIIE family protein phosphatase [Terriglobales bacterium]
MRLPFQSKPEPEPLRQPLPTVVPRIASLDVAAQYCATPMGGDFYDFLEVGPGLLLVLLIDIAGERNQALSVAAAVQEAIHRRGPELFASDVLNEPDAVTSLTLEINQTILSAAGGVRCASAFFGCYNEELGIISYVNPGHVPALVRDPTGITLLETSGLPLGLFSHATHDAMVCALQPGAVLALATRGLLGAKVRGEEYGLERLKTSLAAAPGRGAYDICKKMLADAVEFVEQGKKPGFLRRRYLGNRMGGSDLPGINDMAAVALVHKSAKPAQATAD